MQEGFAAPSKRPNPALVLPTAEQRVPWLNAHGALGGGCGRSGTGLYGLWKLARAEATASKFRRGFT